MIRNRIVWFAGATLGAGLLVWLGTLLVTTDTAVDGAEGDRAGPLIELVTPPHPLRPDALVLPRSLTGIGVRYGQALEPGQFRAWLNGEDVTRAFHPEPGKAEYVDLDGAWLPGENTFRFEFTSRGGAAHSREYRVSVEREQELRHLPRRESAGEGGIVMGTTVPRPSRRAGAEQGGNAATVQSPSGEPPFESGPAESPAGR